MVEVFTHIGSAPDARDDIAPLEVYLARVEDGSAARVRLLWSDPDIVSDLSPEHARRLAVLLCQAADRADGHPTVVRDVSRDAIDQRGEPLGPPQRHSDSLEWISKGGLP
jgi:hypothetical protein